MRAPCPTSSLPPLPCLADTGASDDGPSCWGAVSDRPPDPYVRCRARYKYLQFVCSPPASPGASGFGPNPVPPAPHHHITTSSTAAPGPPSPPSTSTPRRSLPPLSFLLLPSPRGATSPEGPWPATAASSCRHRQPDARAGAPCFCDSEDPARLDGACGPQDRKKRSSARASA